MYSAHGSAESPRPALQSARLLDPVRERLRCLHDRLRTEQACLLRIRAFIRHHRLRHPRTLGDPEVGSFPNALVNEGQVSASTHEQAPCAPPFLHREELLQERPGHGDVGTTRIRPQVLGIAAGTVASPLDALAGIGSPR